MRNEVSRGQSDYGFSNSQKRTAQGADAELVGDIDIALGADDARVADLLDHVVVALPGAAAHGAGDVVAGAGRLALGGSPHGEALAVDVVAAGGTAEDDSVAVAGLQLAEADGAIATERLALGVLDARTAPLLSRNGRCPGEDLAQLLRQQRQLVDQVEAGAEHARQHVQHVLALVALLAVRTGAAGPLGHVNHVDVARRPRQLDKLLGALGGATARAPQHVEALAQGSFVYLVEGLRWLGAAPA